MPQAKIILSGPAADAVAAQAIVDGVMDGLPVTFTNVTSPLVGTDLRIIITVPCETQAEADAALALVPVPEKLKVRLVFEADLAAARRAEWAAARAADAAAKAAADVTAMAKVYIELDKAVMDERVKTDLKAAIAASTGVAEEEAAVEP